MNATLLRRILTWVAPIVISYVFKKYEEKKAHKRRQMETAKQIENQ